MMARSPLERSNQQPRSITLLLLPLTSDEHGLGGDYQRNYSKVGRKKNEYPQLLEIITNIRIENRITISSAACGSGIPQIPLH